MQCPWNTPNDIYRYLNGTVCMYGGKPVYVSNDGMSTTMTLHSLSGNNEIIKKIEASDPDFDIESPRLGYLGQKGRVTRAVRLPQRQFSQGLSTRNVMFYNLDGDNANVSKSMLTVEFERMLLDDYPPFEESFARLKEEKEVCLSRDIAMRRTGSSIEWPLEVFIRGKKVGYIVGNTRTVVVPSAPNGMLISKLLSCFDWKIE